VLAVEDRDVVPGEPKRLDDLGRARLDEGSQQEALVGEPGFGADAQHGLSGPYSDAGWTTSLPASFQAVMPPYWIGWS